MLRDLVTTAAENGQCSPHAVGRRRTLLERVLMSVQADTFLRAVRLSVGAVGAAERLTSAAGREERWIVLTAGVAFWRLTCGVLLTETETDRGNERQ